MELPFNCEKEGNKQAGPEKSGVKCYGEKQSQARGTESAKVGCGAAREGFSFRKS